MRTMCHEWPKLVALSDPGPLPVRRAGACANPRITNSSTCACANSGTHACANSNADWANSSPHTNATLVN